LLFGHNNIIKIIWSLYLFFLIEFQLTLNLYLLVLELSFKLFFLVLLLSVFDVIFYYLEQNNKNLNLIRLIYIMTIIILFGMFSTFLIPDNLNSNFTSFIKVARNYSILILRANRLGWQKINLFLTGSLFLVNETNFGIRYFFDIFHIIPKSNKTNPKDMDLLDKKEYNIGRFIGALERILIFIFVILGEYTAIGFIIWVKGFTRIKMDNRNFAEYVLVGTLLSSLSAIIVAIIIKGLI